MGKMIDIECLGNPRVSNVKQLFLAKKKKPQFVSFGRGLCAHQSHCECLSLCLCTSGPCVWLYLPVCGPHRLACAFLMAWVLVHKVCHACLSAISWNFFSLPSSSDPPPFLVLELGPHKLKWEAVHCCERNEMMCPGNSSWLTDRTSLWRMLARAYGCGWLTLLSPAFAFGPRKARIPVYE